MAAVTAGAYLFLVGSNIAYHCFYRKRILTKDMAFKDWREQYSCSAKTTSFVAALVSFKTIRFLYSRFGGYDRFQAGFSSFDMFWRPLMFFSVFNAFLTLAPIIFIDIVGLTTLPWPTQIYVTLIETLVLSILIIILEIIEMIKVKKLVADDRGYFEV